MNPTEAKRDNSPVRKSQNNVDNTLPVFHLSIRTSTLPPAGNPSQQVPNCTFRGELSGYQIRIGRLEDRPKYNVFIYASRKEANAHLGLFGIKPLDSKFSLAPKPVAHLDPETMIKHTVYVDARKCKLKLVE